MNMLALRVSALFSIVFLVACGGLPPLRQTFVPLDCRRVQPIAELLKKGDAHRLAMMREKAPKGTDPEVWLQIRERHGSRARACYRLVLDIQKDHAYAILNQGFIFLVESTFPDQTPEAKQHALITATNHVQKALNLQRLDAQDYYYLGEIAARRGQCQQATKIFNALLTSDWSYSHVYAWLGYCQEVTGQPKDAQRAYRKAVEISNPVAAAEWARSRIK